MAKTGQGIQSFSVENGPFISTAGNIKNGRRSTECLPNSKAQEAFLVGMRMEQELYTFSSSLGNETRLNFSKVYEKGKYLIAGRTTTHQASEMSLRKNKPWLSF